MLKTSLFDLVKDSSNNSNFKSPTIKETKYNLTYNKSNSKLIKHKSNYQFKVKLPELGFNTIDSAKIIKFKKDNNNFLEILNHKGKSIFGNSVIDNALGTISSFDYNPEDAEKKKLNKNQEGFFPEKINNFDNLNLKSTEDSTSNIFHNDRFNQFELKKNNNNFISINNLNNSLNNLENFKKKIIYKLPKDSNENIKLTKNLIENTQPEIKENNKFFNLKNLSNIKINEKNFTKYKSRRKYNKDILNYTNFNKTTKIKNFNDILNEKKLRETLENINDEFQFEPVKSIENTSDTEAFRKIEKNIIENAKKNNNINNLNLEKENNNKIKLTKKINKKNKNLLNDFQHTNNTSDSIINKINSNKVIFSPSINENKNSFILNNYLNSETRFLSSTKNLTNSNKKSSNLKIHENRNFNKIEMYFLIKNF